MERKQAFERRVETAIHRNGIDRLMAWLETTDFYTAPASTRYHGNYAGGLVDHSLNVFTELLNDPRYSERYKTEGEIIESLALVSLFHDVCKANVYVQETRNRKINGKWEQVPIYVFNDRLPMGHGEKSLWIIDKFINLTTNESMAIRWHMGPFDQAVQGGFRGLSDVWENYPLSFHLHIADLRASYLRDRKEPNL